MCSAEGEKKKENYINIECAKANRMIIICTLLSDKQYIAMTYANPIILWIWKGFSSNATLKRSKFQKQLHGIHYRAGRGFFSSFDSFGLCVRIMMPMYDKQFVILRMFQISKVFEPIPNVMLYFINSNNLNLDSASKQNYYRYQSQIAMQFVHLIWEIDCIEQNKVFC